MVSELIDRLLKSKHEYYMITIALALMVGSAYVYLNFYRGSADIITGGISGGAAALGYFLLLYGFYEATTNYQMQKNLYETQYEIKQIELNIQLKKLKKKYKIKNEKTIHSTIIKNLEKIFSKIDRAISKKLNKRGKSDKFKPSINTKRKFKSR